MKSNLIIVLLLFSNPAFSQQWQYLGLGTENITAIAVDWSCANTLYAGSGSDFSAGTVGGIFKSTDGGMTWDTLGRGVTVREIIIHPTNPNIIYATLGLNVLTVPGVIKSTDGGASWARADSGIRMSWEEGPGPIAIDPKHPDTLYCGTGGPFGGRFYKSTNGGMNWYSFGDTTALRDGVTALAIDHENTNVVYAGTAYSGSLLKSTDGGMNWTSTGLRAGIIYTIELGKKRGTIYVGSSWSDVYPVGLFKTTDLGFTWESLPDGLPDSANVYVIEASSDSTSEKLFTAANWRDSGGVYQSVAGNKWKRIGISGERIGTLKLVGQRLYAGYKGICAMDVPVSVRGKQPPTRMKFNLYNNFPNPFNPSTNITYEIEERTRMFLEILDIQGRQIKILVGKEQSPGKYSVSWNGRNDKGEPVASGVYFYVLRTERQVVAKKMIYLK